LTNVFSKEVEKVEKYQDLLIEIQSFWHAKADVIRIVISALGALKPRFNDWLKRLN